MFKRKRQSSKQLLLKNEAQYKILQLYQGYKLSKFILPHSNPSSIGLHSRPGRILLGVIRIHEQCGPIIWVLHYQLYKCTCQLGFQFLWCHSYCYSALYEQSAQALSLIHIQMCIRDSLNTVHTTVFSKIKNQTQEVINKVISKC